MALSRIQTIHIKIVDKHPHNFDQIILKVFTHNKIFENHL